jgi:CCR4-NOT transcription complex subunit 7/8
MKLCKNLKGGLQEVADQLELRRVGPQHQAGSDSHLTGMAFFKIKEVKLIFNFYYFSIIFERFC